MQRYTSLLLEQKRLIISGPPSSGKSHMAQRLAHFLVESTGDNLSKAASIVTFTIQVSCQLRKFRSHLLTLISIKIILLKI